MQAEINGKPTGEARKYVHRVGSTALRNDEGSICKGEAACQKCT